MSLRAYEFFAALIAGLFETATSSVTTSVITFNYDTLVEDALYALGRWPTFGVARAPYKGNRARAGAGREFLVVKLHGSSSWAYPSVRNTWAHLYDSYSQFGARQEPIVIPPTWRKGDVTPLIEAVWRCAHRELAKATRVCVIGYSWPRTDEHFRNLIAASLVENPALYRMHVVDYVPSDACLIGNRPSNLSIRRAARLFKPLADYDRLTISTCGFRQWLGQGGFRQLGLGEVVGRTEVFGR